MFITKKQFNSKLNQALVKGIEYGKQIEKREFFERTNTANDVRLNFGLKKQTQFKSEVIQWNG